MIDENVSYRIDPYMDHQVNYMNHHINQYLPQNNRLANDAADQQHSVQGMDKIYGDVAPMQQWPGYANSYNAPMMTHGQDYGSMPQSQQCSQAMCQQVCSHTQNQQTFPDHFSSQPQLYNGGIHIFLFLFKSQIPPNNQY
jgi:hypothetical protein